MGVSVDFAVMYGIRFDAKRPAELDEVWDDVSETSSPLEKYFLVDCMLGDYMIIGKQIAYMSQYGNGEGYEKVNLPDLHKERERVINEMSVYYPEIVPLIDKNWDIIVQVHYT